MAAKGEAETNSRMIETLMTFRSASSTLLPTLLGSLLLAAPLATPLVAQPSPRVCDARSFGAKADGMTKDTRAIQAAIDSCAAHGGGTVRLSGGAFLSAPIVLKSHITLDIERGATLLGSTDFNDYPKITEFRQPGRQALVSATHAEDLAIVGGGTINGSGQPWWDALRAAQKKFGRSAPDVRPRLVVFDHCRHIRMQGVTVEDSPMWQIVPYYSSDIVIDHVTVLAPPHAPNTDGIDPFASNHVVIRHVHIDDGDDNVAIKSGQPGSPGPDDPSTDITVTDSVFLHGHGLSIGSEIAGGVQHVTAERIRFEGTDNGIRVKSNRDRGNNIDNFVFRDITMKNVKTAILISEYYPKIPKNDTAEPVTRLTPHFHDIEIDHLTATGSKTAGVIIGLPESPVRNVVLNHVHIAAQTGMTISNATVKTNDLVITPASGPPMRLLENAVVKKQ